MKIDGKPFRTIWTSPDHTSVQIIDQTLLPHEFRIVSLTKFQDAVRAISNMLVRGAPLIGATAAYGMWLAARENPQVNALRTAGEKLIASRPTAMNLKWAVETVLPKLNDTPEADRASAALTFAEQICNEDIASCRRIGHMGLDVIRALPAFQEGRFPINILTHCNAGWLACVDWGTALSPIYTANEKNIDVHIWVDETRPRNQGASLTAFELEQQGIPFHLISDNAGGHLMQEGKVDLCLVGADRVTRNGDVANKIGTYLKALAAYDNNVPFYVAFPGTTIDWETASWREIPIEERPEEEVTSIQGCLQDGTASCVTIGPRNTPAANPAFDVTPAKLISGLITERGVTQATEKDIRRLYPEYGTKG